MTMVVWELEGYLHLTRVWWVNIIVSRRKAVILIKKTIRAALTEAGEGVFILL